jgi:hypothetical protein
MTMRRQIPTQTGLFGGEAPARPVPGSVTTEAAQGYAAPPGTGPEGETCGSCSHCRVKEGRCRGRIRRYYKCAVMLPQWTNRRATDVLIQSPACRQWEKGAPTPTTTRHLNYHDQD